MGSENSGNRELSYSFQNSKNREEAVIKLAEFKEREKRMERQSTVKIVDGREQIEEYYYSKTIPAILTSNPCKCLIIKLYYETYLITLKTEEIDIIIALFKNSLKTDKNTDLGVLLGEIFENNFLETEE